GIVSLGDGSGTCRACHGSDNAAPPRGLGGETGSASPAVGAHQAHVRGGFMRGPIPCGDCHPPLGGATFRERVNAPGHLDSDLPAEVFPGGAAFAGLAAADGATPVYDFESASCGGVYCHGGG